jgi:membrane associated rhomboid family serine protease
MIVIPTGTDAPIYHWPYVTVGLIVLNVLLLFAIPPVASSPKFDENGEIVEGADEVSPFERYALSVGDGRLHPVQWVTHNFLHFGFLHLAGNMLFLWSFGIVVEGKLGPVKYLLAYVLIGALHGAFVQILLKNSGLNQHAAGASAMVYGLLAVCLIWAPRNELNTTVILTAGFRIWVFQWELYYTTVALYYMGTQVFGLVFWGTLGGQLMMTELGHLSGAFWGAVVGVTLLKVGLVDCEGWDVFSLWAKQKKLAHDWKRRGERLDYPKGLGRDRRKARGRKRDQTAEGQAAAGGFEAQSASALGKIRRLIEAGDLDAALHHYRETAKVLFQWPAQPDLYALIKDFHAHGGEVESVRLMRDHCRSYPDESAKLRLKLAQVLIRSVQRPVAALRTLREIPAGSLPADLERLRAKLVLQAERMREEGVIEVEGDDA